MRNEENWKKKNDSHNDIIIIEKKKKKREKDLHKLIGVRLILKRHILHIVLYIRNKDFSLL